MDVTEFARVFYAVNLILEDASAGVGLSKRAALALVLISTKATVNNRDLQQQFVKNNISTDKSAQKDSSTAKSELLDKGYIAIRNNVSVFAITDSGKQAVSTINTAVGDGIEKLGPTDDQRSAMRVLVGLPPRIQPATTVKASQDSGESNTESKSPSKKRPKSG
jgi:hypothetical protein